MEICFACGKPIEERKVPVGVLSSSDSVGKYTVRRTYYDENWNEIIEDNYFHEKCYYEGFISALRYGLAVKEWEDSGRGNVEESLK